MVFSATQTPTAIWVKGRTLWGLPHSLVTPPADRCVISSSYALASGLPKAVVKGWLPMFGELQSMIPHLVVLAILTLITIAIAIYRASISQKQDFHLHYEAAESSTVGQQVAVENRMHTIDKWGKGLTIVTFLYFLVVVGMLVYQQWMKTYSGTMSN